MRNEFNNLAHWCAAKKQGGALVFVLVALVVVSIFAGITASLMSSNLNLAKAQENKMKAHYLAQSGLELCLAALKQDLIPDGVDDSLLYQHFKPSISSPSALTDSLTLENGVVDLKVEAIEVNGSRWIEIQAIGTLDSSGTSRKIVLQFDLANPLVQKKF